MADRGWATSQRTAATKNVIFCEHRICCVTREYLSRLELYCVATTHLSIAQHAIKVIYWWGKVTDTHADLARGPGSLVLGTKSKSAIYANQDMAACDVHACETVVHCKIWGMTLHSLLMCVSLTNVFPAVQLVLRMSTWIMNMSGDVSHWVCGFSRHQFNIFESMLVVSLRKDRAQGSMTIMGSNTMYDTWCFLG